MLSGCTQALNLTVFLQTSPLAFGPAVFLENNRLRSGPEQIDSPVQPPPGTRGCSPSTQPKGSDLSPMRSGLPSSRVAKTKGTAKPPKKKKIAIIIANVIVI